MKLTDEMRASIRAQLVAPPKRRANPDVQARDYKYKTYASDALGVAPDQIAEATAHLRAHGCMADYNSEGQLIVTSDKQFREAAKAGGMWDGRDGYAVRDNEGRPIYTGMDQVRAKEEWKRRLRAG